MTQEELDLLMSSGASGLEDGSENAEEESQGRGDMDDSHKDYRIEASKKWPPPPPTQDYKVVGQLDDVARDSEAKMSQVFDGLEIVNSESSKGHKELDSLKKYIVSQREMCDKLSKKFPEIDLFKKGIESAKKAEESADKITQMLDNINDHSMEAMSIMQYQDIHRQKIERVINIVRTLSQYMNSLFDSDKDDNKRASSAKYIPGDEKNRAATNEEIEDLIASFEK